GSCPPKPPVRFDAKYNVRRSEAIYGWMSFAELFTTGPRFSTFDQKSNTVSRVAVQRSLPSEPGRFEKKNTSSPSNRTDGRRSSPGLLSSATRLAGLHETPS